MTNMITPLGLPATHLPNGQIGLIGIDEMRCIGCRSHIPNLIKAGQFPPGFKVGKRRFWTVEEYNNFIAMKIAEANV